jgi:hypothetical protein
MSLKKKVAAIAATLTSVCGMSAAVAVPASAATPACGQYCIGVFSSELGTYAQPNFVEHVFGGVARIDTETGLTTASSTDPSEDFMNPHQGDVSDYYQLGLVSADVNRHYGSLEASQLEYAPLGQPTGLCVGVPISPYSGEALSLQPCTVPGRTVWIIATALSPATASAGFFPIISGATTDFVHPFAMTYPWHVNTNTMLPAIRLRHLRFRGPAQAVPATQLWGVKLGVL